ncbi:MAG: hypothetical protein A2283_03840 [Lentisphaerae bacterium RIFOXYA12_FULL_48_11]|nr:MAG: hypothetical protein A2283_03840 [Lentisphaerae bacterium RIFOXYA12_FULL_48_11]
MKRDQTKQSWSTIWFAGIIFLFLLAGCNDDATSDVTIDQLIGTYRLIDITFVKADGQVQDSDYLQLKGGMLSIEADGSYTETHFVLDTVQYGSGVMKAMGGNDLELTAIPSGRIIPAEVTLDGSTMTITKWPPDSGEVHTMVWQK